MKLKYNFIINQVADKMVAVAVGDDLNEFNGFLKTNQEGADILEILKEDVTVEEIIAKMSEKYPDAPKEEVEETVTEFVSKLEEAGVIA